jgi:Zn-dependent protease with chaperone function
LRQAVALARTGRRLFLAEFAGGILFLWIVLRLGWASRFRNGAERVSRRKILQAVIFCPALLLTLDIANLPFRLWAHTVLVGYGLSIEGWVPWLVDWAKAEGVSLIITTFIGWLIISLIRRHPRRWWLTAWAVTVPLLILGVYAEPLIVEPLFYEFRPLADGHPALAAQVRKTAARAGVVIPAERIFEMLASKKLTEVNAYVSGIGGSKRVVFWDTTLLQMGESEALSIFGHELGHYALHHIWKGLALAAAGMALGFPLLAWVFNFTLRRWGDGWRIRGPGDWPALAVLLLLVSLAQVALLPVGNAISRHFEHQADVYGLEVIHGVVPDAPQAAARTFQSLGEINLEEPEPSAVTVFFFYTHPPIADRLGFALQYNPWASHVEPEFIK